MGEKDEVIPNGVVDLIMNNADKTSKKELYSIPGCVHKINGWLANNPQELLKVHQKMREFID